MKKRMFAFVAVIMASMFVLGACGGGDSNLIGTWSSLDSPPNQFDVELRSGGSRYFHFHRGGSEPITWSVSDGRLTILDDGATLSFDSFEVIGDVLVLRWGTSSRSLDRVN